MVCLGSTPLLRFWKTLVLVYIVHGSFSYASKKLRMAQVVYRHGDRSPVHVYPNYQHEDYWVGGLGHLTTKGMRQEYALGRFLKSIYINQTGLLNASYVSEQVVCRSTDKDRTLISAQTQLNGLYPPKGRQIWRPKLDWQPIPVHTVSSSEDHLLRVKKHHCPRYVALTEAFRKHPTYLKVQEENEEFFKWLAIKTGKYYDVASVHRVHDCMVTDKAHNLTLPEWANATVLNKLKEISEFEFNWDFVGLEKQRLTGGTLVGEMVSHMEQYKEDPSKLKQMYLYSAHDDTVLALQHALGVASENSFIPPYSSAFMVELYGSDDRSDLSVKMFYRVGQNDTRLVQKLPNCSADCPLQDFISQTASVVPQDIEAECLMRTTHIPGNVTEIPGTEEPAKASNGFKIGFIVVLVLLILLIIAFIAFCCWQHKRPQYSEVTKGA